MDRIPALMSFRRVGEPLAAPRLMTRRGAHGSPTVALGERGTATPRTIGLKERGVHLSTTAEAAPRPVDERIADIGALRRLLIRPEIGRHRRRNRDLDLLRATPDRRGSRLPHPRRHR